MSKWNETIEKLAADSRALTQAEAQAALSTPPLFRPFPSIARLSREIVVTEKIDGTNAQIHVTEDGRVFAGSRNRWLTPEADNFGFARWVAEHEQELLALGPGSHFGEWWGQGIQRRYGLDEKRFSLFNVARWTSDFNRDAATEGLHGNDTRSHEVPILHVVPVLLRAPTFDSALVDEALGVLRDSGSFAAPGFMRPEGVVVYHSQSNTLFKKTLDKNDGHKGAQ